MSIKDEPLYSVMPPKTIVEMSWQEVEEALKETDIILITTGSIENHGPHLPLGADYLKMPIYAKKIARKLESMGIKIVVGPTIPFGVAPYHMGFPGTINMKTDTHINMVVDICESLIKHGFKNVILLNGHGGNSHSVAVAAKILADRTDANIVFIRSPELKKFRDAGWSKSERPYDEFHGGETETARMIYAYPKLVMMDRASEGWSDLADEVWTEIILKYNVDFLSYLTKERYKQLWPLGHGGNPFCADAETGERLFNITVDFVCDFIAEKIAKKTV